MSLSGIVVKKRLLIALITILTGVLGALAAAAPSQAVPTGTAGPTGPVPLTASAAPRVPAGATRLGALAAGTTMQLDVTLNVPDQAALTAFLNGVADPASPFYHQFLGAGQFGPRFGPSLAQVAAVEDALKAAGLSPGAVSSDRLDIPVTASASAIERGFGVTLDRYRMPGGRIAYASTAAPKIPAAIAPLVQGVLGLDDLYPMQSVSSGPATAGPVKAATVRSVAQATSMAPDATGPQPCSAITGSNTANVFAGYYGTNLLYQIGDLGQGQKVGVVEFEPNLPSDITAYEQCYGIRTKVNYLKVDGGAGTGAGSGEAALDIEMLVGLTPNSTIDVYQAPSTQAAGYAIFQKFTARDAEKTLSMSWASCEARTSTAAMNAYETQAEKADAQGQTILAAAGDSGSTGCYDATGSRVLSADSPAIEPYVVGVGGTSFNGNGGAEVVWNDSGSGNGAGGGGVSTHFCMPAYQDQTTIPGVINGDSKKDTSSSCKSKHYRESPDISADGDPLYGYVIYYNGSWQDGIGGTSAATPLWAAIAALTDASPFCSDEGSGTPGVLPQVLYKVASAYHSYVYSPRPEGLRDVTSGNNDYTPSGYRGGRYPAAKGYDMASGLGAAMVGGLSGKNWITFLPGYTALACHAEARKLTSVKVTSVSPKSGKAGKTARVTVRGAGFLPVAGADEARIMSGSKVLATVTASCSTTACTLTLPAESARRVDIKIYAQALWSSSVTRADRYTYTTA